MTTSLELPEDWQRLVVASRDARCHAYAPYSHFLVGAAVQVTDGEVFVGCNVENASYGLTICAERVAMTSAVAAGHRDPQIVCISLSGTPVPCGSCRQFLHEFNPQMTLLLDDAASCGPPEVVTLESLLPRGFELNSQH